MTELEIVRAASAHFLELWIREEAVMQRKPENELLKARERKAWYRFEEINQIVIKLEAKEAKEAK